MNTEALRVVAFMKSGKRERYGAMISAPERRRKFVDLLAHFVDFDPRYRLPILGAKLWPENAAFELMTRGAPSVVYAISEDPALDQKDLPIRDALQQTIGSGMGTVLCCLPGRLAFVETEDERYILERNAAPARQEYVRFVVGRKDEDSQVEQGIFQASALAVEQHLAGSDAEELNELRAWFSENLEKPTCLGRGKQRLGVCWFKTNSTEHISRIWQMVRILERNGVYVNKIRTYNPGYLVYEDEWQLVAEPFREGIGRRR